jgi:tRNA-Thr(GGU) m(6)t(6)A37 methyltransferase TsaA
VPIFTLQPIGYVSSPFKDTAAIPKGLGAQHDAEGVLNLLSEYEAGLTDIEGYSHLIVLWTFDRSDGFDLLVTPPTDNLSHGVFTTRSPRRPNPIGMTVVELLRRDQASLFVRGVDMLDGTPLLDIKPYLSSISPEKLRRGWLSEAEARKKSLSSAVQLTGIGASAGAGLPHHDPAQRRESWLQPLPQPPG